MRGNRGGKLLRWFIWGNIPDEEPEDVREKYEQEAYALANGIVADDWQCRFTEGHHTIESWRNNGHAFVTGNDFWRSHPYFDDAPRCSEIAPNVYAILVSHERVR